MDILSAAVAMDVAIAVGAAAHMCVYENPAWPGVTWRTLARRRVEGPQAVLSARPSRSSRRREFACSVLVAWNIKENFNLLCNDKCLFLFLLTDSIV